MGAARLTGRVLFVAHDGGRSGAPIVLLRFLRWFAESDTPFDTALLRPGPLGRAFGAVGPVHVVGSHPTPTRMRALLGARVPALVVANSAFTHEAVEHMQPSLRGIPLLSWVHESQGGLRGLRLRVRGARIQRYAAVSPQVAAHLAATLGIAQDAVSICPPFVELSRMATRPSLRARERLGAGADTFVVGSCGTLWSYKGPDLFVELAAAVRARAPRTPVLFAWVGGDWRRREARAVRELAGRRRVEDILTFISSIDDPIPLMAAFDVFALTSREDPLPLVCLEAAALGKPVLCFDAGGAPDVLAEGRGIVVPAFDVARMAAAVCRLAEDRAARERIGRRASDHVACTYDVDVAAPLLLAAMHGAIHDRARDRAPG